MLLPNEVRRLPNVALASPPLFSPEKIPRGILSTSPRQTCSVTVWSLRPNDHLAARWLDRRHRRRPPPAPNRKRDADPRGRGPAPVRHLAASDRRRAGHHGRYGLTATDAQVAGFADLYLEYDAQRHVTLETTDGGLYNYRFSFTTNFTPGYFDDYNNWKTKTVETRPDGSIVTAYSNFVQGVILKQLAGGSEKWIEAVHFNDRADVDQYAYPSAVVSFDDTQNDLGGVATAVRIASWTVFDDVNMQIRTAQGYTTGTSPSYSYTLVNPVSITIMEGDGNVTGQIQAVRSSTSGPLLPTDSFPQSSWSRWTHNVFSDNDQQTATQVYFLIPASGSGSKGVNYNETDFGFDSIGQ